MDIPAPIVCKCCGCQSNFVGNIDSNKTCMDHLGERIFPVSPQLIPYWACTDCGFIFTNHMDDWSPEDFQREIYNREYVKADPPIPGRENVPIRETPAYATGLHLAGLLSSSKKEIRVLDFGSGGNPGPTGLALQEKGFDVTSYDPYRGDTSNLQKIKFDVIIAVEVFEHCHDLNQLKEFMVKHLSRDGIIYISTLFHEFPTPTNILGSWYIAPRNGHISIFTFIALTVLFRSVGINIVQTIQGTFGFKSIPRFKNLIFVNSLSRFSLGKRFRFLTR